MTHFRSAGSAWHGLAIVAGASASFSVAVLAVPPIYDGGGNPFGLLVLRNLVLAGLIAAVLAGAGRPVLLASAERRGSFLIGLVFAAQSACFYSALTLIPVGFATLVVFLYPLIVALWMRRASGEVLGWTKLAGLLAALCGLALALDARAGRLDPLGIALAALAALGSAAMAVIGNRILRSADSWRMTAHMSAATGLALAAAALVSGEGLRFPSTPDGQVGYTVAMVFYMAGIAGYFRGLQMIGATPTAMTSNVEPVVTLMLGWLIWGDTLGPWQIAGALLVVGAVFHSQWRERR
ncbi:MAG: DMT family transporter [Alphaproteobacteria bacterium]